MNCLKAFFRGLTISTKFKKCKECGLIFQLSFKYWHSSKAGKDGFRPICKECVNKKRRVSVDKRLKPVCQDGYKVCSKCGYPFPLNGEYWTKNNQQKDGWHTRCKNCRHEERRIYYLKNRDKELEYVSNYRKNNKGKFTKRSHNYYSKNKSTILKKNRTYSKSLAKYDVFQQQLSWAEEIRKSSTVDGAMETRCAYCGRWFIPTVLEARRRVVGLNSDISSGRGEGRMYCSSGCKHSCPVYQQVNWPKGFKKASSRESNPLLRQLVLLRDDYTCQECGVAIGDGVQLHCHHVVPVRQNPMTANDPDACITLCKKCHIAVHKKKGCEYNSLKCE